MTQDQAQSAGKGDALDTDSYAELSHLLVSPRAPREGAMHCDSVH